MLNIIFKPKVLPNFELIELENVCRICLHSARNMLSLFNNEIDSLISEFLEQKLHRKPSKPHQICAKCFEEAKIAYRFKKQCQYADQLIKSMLNEPNISKTYNEKYTQTDVSNFIYPCEKCEKKFDSSEILKEHRLNDHRNTPNICRACGKVLSSIATLRDHLISVHPELGFISNHKCRLCEKFFSKKVHLRRHLFNIHNINEYFTTRDEINGAIEEDNIFAKNDNEVSCINCLKNFEVEGDLKNHECVTFLYEKDRNSLNWLHSINDCDDKEIQNVPVSEESYDCDPVFVDNLKTDYEYEENTFEKNEDQKFVSEIEIKTEKLFAEELKVSDEISGAAITEPKEKITREMNTNDNTKQFDCIMCSKSFIRKDHLQRHVKTIHIDKKIFKKQIDLKYHMNRKINSSTHKRNRKTKLFSCKICMKEFISEKILRNHIAVIHNGTKEFSCKYCNHTGERPFECSHCPMGFKDKLTLKRYNRKHTGERSYCDLCNLSFSSSTILLNHKRRVHGIDKTKEFSCKICLEKIIGAMEYQKHCKVLHTTKTKSHICSECGAGFTESRLLKVHIRKHTGEKPFICEYCDKAFTQLSNLYRHKKIHTGEKNYHCTNCSKSFSQSSSLKSHMRTHTGERPFKCSHCPMTFKDKLTLKRHISKYTGERFYCDLCGLSYSTSTILLNHKRRVHDIDKTKEFSCKICLEKIIGAMEYQKHCEVLHTAKTKSHICSECGAGFIQSHQLKVHIRKHTGEKPCICEYCGRAFAQPSNLDCHKKIHTGEKNYHCTNCSKSFSQSSSLKFHMRTHTGERPYKCSHCPMAFTENRALKKHLGKHSE